MDFVHATLECSKLPSRTSADTNEIWVDPAYFVSEKGIRMGR